MYTKRAFALLLACFLPAGLALAAPRDLPQPHAWAPPARYDHTPRRPMVVREYPRHKVGEICGMLTKVRADGCALPDWRGTCIVYMPPRASLSPARWTALLRHERGHCNGWPAHHPR